MRGEVVSWFRMLLNRGFIMDPNRPQVLKGIYRGSFQGIHKGSIGFRVQGLGRGGSLDHLG